MLMMLPLLLMLPLHHGVYCLPRSCYLRDVFFIVGRVACSLSQMLALLLLSLRPGWRPPTDLPGDRLVLPLKSSQESEAPNRLQALASCKSEIALVIQPVPHQMTCGGFCFAASAWHCRHTHVGLAYRTRTCLASASANIRSL